MSDQQDNAPKVPVKLGPYTQEQFDDLEYAQGLRKKLMDVQTKNGLEVPDDEDGIRLLLDTTDKFSMEIHRTANTLSKHEIGKSQAASAEDTAALVRDIQRRMGESRNALPQEEASMRIIPDEHTIDIVPGHTDIGIDKPSLKEIMDTEEDD